MRIALASLTLVLVALLVTAAAPSKTLRLSWTTPARTGVDANHDGIVDPTTTPEQVSPTRRPVDVRVGGCPAGVSFRVDGAPATAARRAPCSWRLQVAGLGRHRVVARTATASGTVAVDLRDFLVFGLGDSIASGEGSPDVPGSSPRWQDASCHRSANAFEARAALALERRDAHSTVTFVHLACSGAGIERGLIGSYGNPGAAVPAQLDELRRLAGKRPIDAVVISAGINDIGWTDFILFCLQQQACMDKPYPTPTSSQTLAAAVTGDLARLPARYEELRTALAGIGIPPRRVYVTEYPDPTHDASGTGYCDPLLAVPTYGTIDGREGAWASQGFLAPLNAIVRDAAARAGWRLVDGVPAAFASHGVCSSAPWSAGIFESLRAEGSVEGTLHPNLAGQQGIAALLEPALVSDLFPGGKARSAAVALHSAATR